MSELMLMIVSIFRMMFIPIIAMVINTMLHYGTRDEEEEKRARFG